ncbi:MAG: hypothetical protein NVSMB64_29040 [Candidatus Velthaea sp.]
MVWFCRFFAALLIIGAVAGTIATSVWSTREGTFRFVARAGHRVIARVPAGTQSVRLGEVVDLADISTAERYRLTAPTLQSGWYVPVVRAGHVERVFVPRPPDRPAVWRFNPGSLALLVELVVSVLVGAIVLWRRPSPTALLFGLYCAQVIPTIPNLFWLTPLPDGLFGAVAPLWFVLTNDIGTFALVVFVLRFPQPSASHAGRIVLRFATGALAAIAVFYTIRSALVFPLDLNDGVLDVAPAIVALAALIVSTLVRFLRASGPDRRRLAWVMIGVIVSGISTTALYLDSGASAGPFVFPHWVTIADYYLGAVLPLALGYAILRHRVIDIGFAVNRGIIYGIITLALVTAVSLVDWLSGRFFAQGRFSLALEAAVSVTFGVALSSIHVRVERLMDRVFFRERHRAERRIEERIEALDFAAQSVTVDETLVTEAASILRLVSAAVYRRTSKDLFECTAAHGWPRDPPFFRDDDLIVRTLRAKERTVVLRESAIDDVRFPNGSARPELAMPLAIRHELRGFVLYAERPAATALDPLERRLLESLVRHAAVAYDAIEADAFRREALTLRESAVSRMSVVAEIGD